MVSTFRTWALSSLLFIASVASSAANASIEMYAAVDGQSQALVLEPNGRVQQEGDPATHYKGHLKDHPGSWVRVSHIDGQWSGLLSHRGQFFEVTSLSVAPITARNSKQAQAKALDGSAFSSTEASALSFPPITKAVAPKSLISWMAFTRMT